MHNPIPSTRHRPSNVWPWVLLAGSGLSGLFLHQPSLAQSVRADFSATDGEVRTEVISGNLLYIGGSFHHVGVVTGPGAAIDATTGQVVKPFPLVDAGGGGSIRAVASDGAGGWFIGGGFTTVGGLPRLGLAHILSDNTVSSWNPSGGGQVSVSTIVVVGSTVYVGGGFTQMGGQARSNIAAVDAVTGNATSWNPGSNGGVSVLAVVGSVAYAGGFFSNIGGQARSRLAALDLTTGSATAWNPSPSGHFGDPFQTYISGLAVIGSTVYACGSFTSIGFQLRNGLAALDAATGSATSWNPNPNGEVRALATSGSVLYAGGHFTNFGGWTTSGVAAIDAATGNTLPFYAALNDYGVYALAVSGSTVYAGGVFTADSGVPYERLVAMDASSGSPMAWNPKANQIVYALAADGSRVFAGGDFTMIGAEQRHNLAAVNLTTGLPTSWNPDPSGSGDYVDGLSVKGSTVYVCGGFGSIGGQPRTYIAALDAATGSATAFNPPPTPGGISSIVHVWAGAGVVYAAGFFTGIAGVPRNGFAALDSVTGNATAFNPNPNREVNGLVMNGSTLYVGGNFTSIGGQPRGYIAALDATTGNATAWDPTAGSTVFALALNGSAVYAGGYFTFIGGASVPYLAAVDATTGNAIPTWNPNLNNPVTALLLGESAIYMAGRSLSMVGGQNRAGMAAVDLATAGVTGWNPSPSGTLGTVPVYTMVLNGSTVYVGGDFRRIGGSTHYNLAAVDASTPTGVPFPAPVDRGLSILGIRPNPAPAAAEVEFTLPREFEVELRVIDVSGREVARPLHDQKLGPGVHRVPVDTRRLANGVYVCLLRAGGRAAVVRLAVVR